MSRYTRKQTMETFRTDTIPDVSKTLNMSVDLIAAELLRIRERAEKEPLSPDDRKAVADYVRLLVLVNKDRRDAMIEDAESMDDESLIREVERLQLGVAKRKAV